MFQKQIADIAVTENMNVPELLHVDYSGERPVVSGRELHEALKVKTEYAKWLERMCEYGFTEGKDFSSILTKSTGERPSTDHALTIPMAKELCMLPRNERGKFFRQYSIRIDAVHERPEGMASRNFRTNRKYFIEKEDYYVINQPDKIRRLGFTRPQGRVPASVILITESGYLMLVKSFTDDLAWSVQRQLVNNYFRVQQIQRVTDSKTG